MPSIGNIIFVALLLILAVNTAEGLLGDGDTAYHIKTGEVILDGAAIPRHDPYSFIVPTLPWTAHEWLSEVIMAVIYRGMGLSGLVVFFAAILATTHWLLYVFLRTKSNDLILCTLVTLFATLTASSHWLARPHVFSLALTLIWYALLDRFHYDGKSTLKYLPLLMLLWVNLHGGFVIGIVLLAVYLAGNFLKALTTSPSGAQDHQAKVKALGVTTLLTLAACAINPVGIDIFLFPLRVTNDRFIMDSVTEFLSPNFHQPLPFKFMFLTVIAALALSRARLNFIEAALLTLSSYMALYSVRHVTIFAIFTAPILLRLLSGLADSLPHRLSKLYGTRRQLFSQLDDQLVGKFWPPVGLAFVLGLMIFGSLPRNFNEKVFPVAAVNFLKQEKLAGNMFNHDEFGDYLIFSAWPQYKVFTDGRSDMYGEQHGRPYFRVVGLEPGWRDVLNRYDITWVFFPTRTALTTTLKELPDWHVIYSDKVATILVQNIPVHRHLIAKYPSVTIQP